MYQEQIIDYKNQLDLQVDDYIQRHYSFEATNLRSQTLKRKKAPLAVFFTSFGPTKTKEGIQIIHNTLQSLSYLQPMIQCVVYTTNNEFVDLIHQSHCQLIHDFKTNEKEIPFIKDLFIDIQNRYDASFYGYLNSDILFDDTIISTLQSVHIAIQNKQIKKKVLLTGQRTNVDFVNNRPIPSSSLYHSYIQYLARIGNLFTGLALDYFIFSKGCFPPKGFPDFIIGRVGYDNYIGDSIYHNRKDYDWIDITNTVPAIHQTDSRGNESGRHSKEDIFYNIYISNYQLDHGDIHYSNYYTYDIDGHINVLPKGEDYRKEMISTLYEDELDSQQLSYISPYMLNKTNCIVYGEEYLYGSISKLCKRTILLLYQYDSCLQIQELLSSDPAIQVLCRPNQKTISTSKKNDPASYYNAYFLAIRDLPFSLDAVFIYNHHIDETVQTISFMILNQRHDGFINDSTYYNISPNRTATYSFIQANSTPTINSNLSKNIKSLIMSAKRNKIKS